MHSHSQITLTQIFLLTTIAAMAVLVFRFIGMYGSLIACLAVACWRLPAYDGVNPIVLGMVYGTSWLVLTCGLAYVMNVSPTNAVMPCCILPSIAYFVGVTKGMEPNY